MRHCPNCATELSSTATQCPKCLAMVGWGADGQPAADSSQSGDRHGPVPAIETIGERTKSFAIGFREPGFVAASFKPTNSFRLVGKGTIVLDSGTVSFEGKRHRLFWFGVHQELAFKSSSIVGVYRSGKMLRVEFAVEDRRRLVATSVPTNRANAPFITFWAADDAMAAEIESLLPRRQDGQVTPELVDEAEFQARLRAATPKAYVTPALVGLNVLVFLAMLAVGADFIQPKADVLVMYGSNFGPLTTDGQWWRLFTSMFLHFGVIHLALNMWALYETGRLVERLYGNMYFLVLYLLAGLGGSLASLLWNPMVNSVGASGAIFGVFGALLAFMVNKDNRVPLAAMKKQRASTLLFIANSLFYGFSHAGIDNAAHLGGLASGFLLGLLLARPLDPKVRVQGGAKRLSASSAAGALVLVLLSFAIRIDPNDAKVHSIRGGYHLAQGNLDPGIIELDQAIRLNPNNARAYLLRGSAKKNKGDIEGAIADLTLAIQDDPKSAVAHNQLAWLLATAAKPGIRDGRRALESALRACELSQWKNATFIDTLAAAYARSGDFAKAAEWQQKAAADPQLGRDDTALQRLRLYQAGKAYPPD